MEQLGITGIENVDCSKTEGDFDIYDIYGMKYETSDIKNLPEGIYIKRYDDGTTIKFLNKKSEKLISRFICCISLCSRFVKYVLARCCMKTASR